MEWTDGLRCVGRDGVIGSPMELSAMGAVEVSGVKATR